MRTHPTGLCLFATAGILACVLASGCPAPVNGRLYVKADATGAGTGSDWGNAMPSLHDALDVASRDLSITEIWVAAGTYRPAIPDGDRTASFRIMNGVAVYGGFAGTEGALEERNPQANATILSGDLDSNDQGFLNNGENSYHVVTSSNNDGSAVLSGFIIRGGNANPDANPNGAGLLILNGSPMVAGCRIEGNTALVNGAGAFNYYASPTYTDCTFTGNAATGTGGGMVNLSSNTVLTHCQFIENRANDGAGLFNRDNSQPQIAGCLFQGNSAAESGGAVGNSASAPVFVDCTFQGNVADLGGGVNSFNASTPSFQACIFENNTAQSDGGAMLSVVNSIARIVGCTFQSNTANRSGGAMMNSAGSDAILVNCSFLGNSAFTSGGALFNFTSRPSLTNCVFSANTGTMGGAILNRDGSDARITNCTFNRNLATLGGALYNNINSSPALTNCILWGNVDDAGVTAESQMRTETGAPTVNYSCFQGGWTGSGGVGNISSDPLFIDAAGPDGQGGTGDEDLHISDGSHCIDAGDNTAVPPDTVDLNANQDTLEPTPVDRDGNARFVDDPAAPNIGNGTSPMVDMGAYEKQQ